MGIWDIYGLIIAFYNTSNYGFSDTYQLTESTNIGLPSGELT